jgi:GxxExxY protein
MNENEISYLIRGAAFKVYQKIGPGLLESAYEQALVHELKLIGLEVRNQIGVPFIYDEIQINVGYRVDIIVNDEVIIEVKSVENLAELHHKQLLSYLRLTGKKLGLLIDFNSTDLSKSMYRIVNNL